MFLLNIMVLYYTQILFQESFYINNIYIRLLQNDVLYYWRQWKIALLLCVTALLTGEDLKDHFPKLEKQGDKFDLNSPIYEIDGT